MNQTMREVSSPPEVPQDSSGLMKVSLERNIFTPIDVARVSHGVHYTEADCWLLAPVLEFLHRVCEKNDISVALDPFAGEGHMLQAISRWNPSLRIQGMDLKGGQWPVNDSLMHIPAPPGAVICTNPPYLAKYSAKRKGVAALVSKYFDSCAYDDLYLIAIDRMLNTGCPASVARVSEADPGLFL